MRSAALLLGAFCVGLLLGALYAAWAELMYYWGKR